MFDPIQDEIRDKLSPIEITVEYFLYEKDEPVQPVLDLLAGTTSSTEAEIFKDCGADEVCIPDLKLQSSLYAFAFLLYHRRKTKSGRGHFRRNQLSSSVTAYRF